MENEELCIEEEVVNIMALIGCKVYEARLAKGLSGYEVGRICGIEPTYIYRVESGKKNASLSFLLQLCLGLEIPISFFVDLSRYGINQDKVLEHLIDIK